MTTALEILAPRPRREHQDAGRVGHHRSIGALSGALDRFFWRRPTATAGNPAARLGLEVLLAGPRLKPQGGPVRVALAGDMTARIVTASGEARSVAAWSTSDAGGRRRTA